MKGINYWRVREQAALERYLAEETDYEARLEEIYKTAADNIEKEIQSLLSKYAATENITMAEARKRADRMDVEAFSRKAARYVKEKNFSEKANRELKLYNLKMKISRLELLKKHINLELIAAADEAERELRSDLEKRAMDELKRQAGILGGGAENVAEAAKAIAAGTFYGETFSERLWTNTEAMNKKLSALLSSGLIRGQNPRVLARSIRDQYIGPERLKNGRRGAVYAAERLMRTELARVQTEAQLRSFEANGIEEYEFIATTNCCPICDALDGKHFKVRDLVAGENAPPMHPNCRCSAAPWVGEEDDEVQAGATRRNLAKNVDDSRFVSKMPKDIYSVQDVLAEMGTSPIGRKVIDWINNSPVRIEFTEAPIYTTERGWQQGEVINLYPENCASLRVMAQTLIHEMGHYHFNIGCCQHAEAICFGLEKLHITKSEKLTQEEWDYVKYLAIANYDGQEWEAGGYGNFEQAEREIIG